jgi:hypothetical protein
MLASKSENIGNLFLGLFVRITTCALPTAGYWPHSDASGPF